MKKTILLFSIISIIFSCSQTPEQIQEDINQKYLDQAKSFIQGKIDKANKDQDITIIGFDNLNIDTMMVLTSQFVEKIKMQPLWNQYNFEKKYLDKLVDINNSFGVEPDKMTIASRDKCQMIIDSLQRWEDRSKLLSDSDTLGYGLQFSYDLKQSDGVSLKERKFTIYFDKNHDINGDWNN